MEIYGPEASGKTTLALHVIAEAQKQGGYFHTYFRNDSYCLLLLVIYDLGFQLL